MNRNDATIVLSTQIFASQTTSPTTAVEIDGCSGQIATQTFTTAGLGVTSFALTNSVITTNNIVIPTIMTYSGTLVTNGLPSVICTNIANGSIRINIINSHPTNALNGFFTIGFLVC